MNDDTVHIIEYDYTLYRDINIHCLVSFNTFYASGHPPPPHFMPAQPRRHDVAVLLTDCKTGRVIKILKLDQ